MACKYDDESKRKYSEPAKPAQSAPSAEQFLELDKRLQVDMKSEGDEYAPARWDVVYCHPEHRQNVRFRNDNDAATQRVQVRGMISMYADADAYAALRTAQLAQELLDEKEERKSFEQGWLAEKAKCAQLERERDKWQTLFYESEEYNCSCNIVDTSKPVGDPYNYVCDWHEKHPHIAVAREEVLTLATRAETAKTALSEARERTIRDVEEMAGYMADAKLDTGTKAVKVAAYLLGMKLRLTSSASGAAK